MSRKCAFTICAQNYVGLALALKRSISEKNSDLDFFIIVADSTEDEALSDIPDELISAINFCNIDPIVWREMSFKYDLVEFCTAIKPYCFRSLLDKGYEKILYFDPDIFVFTPLEPVFDVLNHHKVIVTPHRLDLNNDMPARGGVYNLGFIGVKACKSTDRMIAWWQDRLRKDCNIDPMRGFMTDQKWMDHLSVVYDNDEVYVTRDPGLNYGPWNFQERNSFSENGNYYVQLKNTEVRKPLVFLHYSAMRFRQIASNDYTEVDKIIKDHGSTLKELVRKYGTAIKEAGFLKYLQINYRYNSYSDGSQIEYSHRRIFKRLLDEGYSFENPFDSSGEFHRMIHESGMISSAGINSDRLKSDDVPNVETKIKIIDTMAIGFIKLFGYARFNLMARFFVRYFHIQNRARFLNPKFRKLPINIF